MQTLAVFGNPSRRRKSGKRRSAAQKAATARMLAANRKTKSGGGAKRRRRRASVAASPAPRRVSRRRSVRRASRRSGSMRGFTSGLRASGIVDMLKNGAIGGAGAVGVDVAMGYVAPMLPASMATPTDQVTGGPNYGYFATKAALAIAVGHFGKRLSPRYAPLAANGALTVLAYQFLKPMIASNFSLGYMNPAPTMRPRLNGVRGVNAYVSGMGAYQNVRALRPAAGGSRAANAMNAVTRSQRVA